MGAVIIAVVVAAAGDSKLLLQMGVGWQPRRPMSDCRCGCYSCCVQSWGCCGRSQGVWIRSYLSCRGCCCNAGVESGLVTGAAVGSAAGAVTEVETAVVKGVAGAAMVVVVVVAVMEARCATGVGLKP